MLLKAACVYFIAFFLLPIISLAQSPIDSCITHTFQKELIDTNTNLGFNQISNIIETRDSGFVISGRAYSHLQSPTNGDPWYDTSYITRLNRDGDVLWSKVFRDSLSTQTNKVIELKDSCLLLIHTFNQYDNFSLSKFGKMGNVIWKKNYFDSLPYAMSSLNDVMLATDGNLIATGWGDDGFLITKFDSAGNILWAKDYQLPLFGFGIGIVTGAFNNKVVVEVSDGYVIMSHSVDPSSSNDLPIYLFKIDKQTGEIIWTKLINLPDCQLVSFSMTILNGGFLINAQLRDRLTQERTVSLIKIDRNATVIKAIKINNLYFSQASITTTAGKIVMAATDTSSQNTAPFILYQLDSDLNIDWAKKYVIPADSLWLRQARPILVETKDRGILTIVKRRNPSNTKTYNYLIKTDQTGNSGDCENRNFSITTANIFPTTTTFAGTSTDRTFRYSPTSLLVFDKNLITNTICERNTFCDSIKLFGQDSTCSLSDSLRFRIQRNVGCFTTPIWKLADTSYGTIIVGSDSTMKIKFNKTGSVLLRVFLPTACETLQDSMLLHIFKPAASLNIGSNKTYCGTANFNFDAGAGYKDYRWQNGSVNQTLNVNAAGTFYVTVKDYCNNSFTDTVHVTQASPELIDIGAALFICAKDSVVLAAPAGFGNYTWSPNYNIISNNASAIVFPGTTTKYFLFAEKSPGCVSRDSVIVTVNQAPIVNLGADTSICSGDSKTLDAGVGFSEYAWSTGASSQQISATTASTYWVKVTDVNGCKASDSMSILSVYPLPAVSLAKDSFLCSGTSLLLNAGAGASSYLWQNGTSNQTLNVSTIGKYLVKVTSVNNCVASDSTEIKFINPSPSNFIIADSSICKSAAITLSPLKSFSSYLWSTGATNNNIMITNAGSYWLEVTDSYGCKGKDFTVVTTKDCLNRIFFPNAFTPNGDASNDSFKPATTGILSKYFTAVYNRYGQIVFSTHDPAKGWDGRIAGAQQNTSTYTWYSNYQFLNELPAFQKGTVTLIR